jgi:organic radical activating enzyme
MSEEYKVVEIFRSIQGEGDQTGTPCIFIRMFGCNLKCPFCDTPEGLSGSYHKFTTEKILEKIKKYPEIKQIIITGGEPLLQDVKKLAIDIVLSDGPKDYRVGIETNGTIALPNEETLPFNHVSLSPKMPLKECKIKNCHSLKILYPYQNGVTADEYKPMLIDPINRIDLKMKCFIQPIEDENGDQNLCSALQEVYRLGHPWRLGVQLHNLIGIK